MPKTSRKPAQPDPITDPLFAAFLIYVTNFNPDLDAQNDLATVATNARRLCPPTYCARLRTSPSGLTRTTSYGNG